VCAELISLRINLVYGDTVADCTSSLRDQINGVITTEPDILLDKSENVEMPSYQFSSYADLELDYWNSLASEVFLY
jgi:hypothetical protein